jgi:ABC-type lipoprotein release transport system permease subunit
MFSSLFGRRDRGAGRRGRRSRVTGCLLWLLLVIVLLIVLSLMFGGFQKGTKAHSLGNVRTSGTIVAAEVTPYAR